MKNTFAGDVTITKSNIDEWLNNNRTIKHITGSLSIHADAKLEGVKSVGKDLYIRNNVIAILNNLMRVGRDFVVDGDAHSQTRNLMDIGRDLIVDGPTNLRNLKIVRRDIYQRWGLLAGQLKFVGGNLVNYPGYKLVTNKCFLVAGDIYIAGGIWTLEDAFGERKILPAADEPTLKEADDPIFFTSLKNVDSHLPSFFSPWE